MEARKAREGFIKARSATNYETDMPSSKKKAQARQQKRLGTLNPTTLNVIDLGSASAPQGWPVRGFTPTGPTRRSIACDEHAYG